MRQFAALVLPAVEPADHRDRVLVAELLERPSGERGPDAAGAHDDDRLRLVGDATLDLRLEVAPGQEHRAGHRALLELVGLADVEQGRTVGEQLLRLGGGHLGDLRLGFVEEVSK